MGPGNIYNRLQLSPQHLSRQHLSWGHLSISAISQWLPAWYGSNFKQRVLGTYKTDQNCHHNICPCHICPGDICPYQQYPSCYWPDLDQTLNKGSWEHIQQIKTVTTTFVQATFVHISNISAVTSLILIKLQTKGPWNIYNRLQLSPRHLSRQHLSWGHLSISAI